MRQLLIPRSSRTSLPEGPVGFVGSNWAALLEVLEPIPSAAQPVSVIELDAAGRSLGETLRLWLQDVGFDLYDLPDGALYFDVLRHDL